MKTLYIILLMSLTSFILSQEKTILMQRVESLHTVEPYPVGKIVALNNLGDTFAVDYYLRDIYLLKNGSNTWSNIGGNSITGIYVSPDNSIFVESAYGLYHSTNTSTYSLAQILVSTQVFSTAVNSLGTIYSGTTDGLYRSDNNGTFWSITYEYPLKMVIDNNDIMYIEEYNKGLCKSSDNGVTWEEINYNLSKDIEINDIEIAMDGTVFISVKDNGIYKMVDNTWVVQGFQYTNVNSIHTVNDGFIYCSTADVIYKKTFAANAGDWINIKSTMGRITTFSSNSNKLIAGYTDDMLIFETTDSGMTWTENGQIIYPTILSVATLVNYVFVGTDDGVYTSSDNGVTWGAKQLTGEINAIEFGLYNWVFLGTNSGLYRSRDNGATWVNRAAPINIIEEIVYKDSIYYVGGDGGLYKSINNGSTWDRLFFYGDADDLDVLHNGRIFRLDYWDGILYTDDEVNWTDCEIGNRAICLEANSNGDVYAETTNGLQVLRSGQSEWNLIFNSTIYDISFSYDGMVFATSGGSFYYSQL
ncbi:MAG: hypothetical protein GQ534_03945, partial [Candidatus Delongbacteria bacterium]|nr:hypothetical protein [Candidatus Delongbacteria bacterium]